MIESRSMGSSFCCRNFFREMHTANSRQELESAWSQSAKTRPRVKQVTAITNPRFFLTSLSLTGPGAVRTNWYDVSIAFVPIPRHLLPSDVCILIRRWARAGTCIVRIPKRSYSIGCRAPGPCGPWRAGGRTHATRRSPRILKLLRTGSLLRVSIRPFKPSAGRVGRGLCDTRRSVPECVCGGGREIQANLRASRNRCRSIPGESDAGLCRRLQWES